MGVRSLHCQNDIKIRCNPMFKVLKPENEYVEEFTRQLIFDNSHRLELFLLVAVLAISMITLSDLIGLTLLVRSIFIARIVLVIFLLFVLLVLLYVKKNIKRFNGKEVAILKIITSCFEIAALLIGGYFTTIMFDLNIYSFSVFLLVSAVTSMICVYSPYFSLILTLATYSMLTMYIAFYTHPITLWTDEFIIALLFIIYIHIGTVFNYNRHVKMFMQDKSILKMNQKLRELSQIDHLTKIYTRRVVLEKIEEYIALAERYNTPFSLMIFDIDHFKRVNDTYGHNIGDVVLQQLVDNIRARLRSTDIFGRWGGEEFIILIPNDEGRGAFELMETLRKETENYIFPSAGRITISAGVSIYSPYDSATDLIRKADDALYKAKESGRNQTQLYHFEDARFGFYEKVNNEP